MGADTAFVKNRRLNTAKLLMGLYEDAVKEGNECERGEKKHQMDVMSKEYGMCFNIVTGEVSYLK